MSTALRGQPCSRGLEPTDPVLRAPVASHASSPRHGDVVAGGCPVDKAGLLVNRPAVRPYVYDLAPVSTSLAP